MIIKLDNITITDNTKELDSTTLLVKTRLNEGYINNIDSDKIISPAKLKDYLSHSPKIVGITGTNGKTTIACCIYSMLLSLGYKCALCGTRGFFINDKEITPKGLTTPTLLELYYNIHLASLEQCDYFIMEVSSHAIAQDRIEGLEFALKILSNIESDHLDFHKSRDEYIRVKNAFFSDNAFKLINSDCKEASFNVENAYTYGIENLANLKVNAYSIKDSIDAHITWNDFRTKENLSASVESSLVGKYNLYNILASIGALKILLKDISLEAIAKALLEFGGVEGRMQVVHNKPLVIVDFAHTPDGMKNIFEAFRGHKIKVLFGAGGNRDKTKRPEMGKIASYYAKWIYLTSDNPRNEVPEDIINDILQGIKDKSKVSVESNRLLAIHKALDELHDDEILLLLGKGDETYQIIGDKSIPFDDRKVVAEYYKN